MAVESLSDFETMSFLPHVIVYTVYVAVKYTVLLMEVVLYFLSSRHRHSTVEKIANSDVVHILFFLLSLVASCFCCCWCCGKKRGAISYLFDKTHLLSAKLMHFMVTTLFGSGDGIVERYLKRGKAKKLKTAAGNIPRLYIRNVKLSSYEVSHLALLIFTFFFLADITSWDIFFLEESHVCSESPNVSCFPVPKDLSSISDGIELDVDFSELHKQRIANCSFWNSENVSGQVTFVCFEWVFNSDSTLSAIGGLLTVFVLTVKIVTAALIALSEAVIDKVIQWNGNGEWINVCSSFRFRIGDGLKAVRLTILVLVALFELTLGLLLSIGYANIQGKHTNGLFRFYRNLGNQALLSIGILSIILLLPFEKYAMSGSGRTGVPSDGVSGGEEEDTSEEGEGEGEGEGDRGHRPAMEDV
jgi:hypothetical protein